MPSIGRTEKGGTGVSLFSFHFFVTAGAYTDKEQRKRWRQLIGHKGEKRKWPWPVKALTLGGREQRHKYIRPAFNRLQANGQGFAG